MSFLADLRRELARVGIRGRLARRIELELADHLACDPQARLGAPAEIADRFAAELRIVRTRRSLLETFGALALCAGLTFVLGSTRLRDARPDPLVGLSVVILSQVAFVAGMLALFGLCARTAGELRLAQRRAFVALVAGGGICAAGITRGPEAWVQLLALVPLAAVAFGLWRTFGAATVTRQRVGRPAPEIPLWGYALLGSVAVAAVFLQGAIFESSVVEGLIRASFEAAGLAAAVAVLGRPLGLRA